jgi:hypothetical protein
MSYKEKSLVEEALLQMKNLEEAVTQNAKGILASTMKEEIKELVKESLEKEVKEGMEIKSSEKKKESEMTEQGNMELDIDDTEEESDDVTGDDEEIELDTMFMDKDSDDEGFDLGVDDEEVMLPLDLTGASDEEILKVFKAMGDEDGIIVKKDGEEIHLKDENSDVEYKIDLGESEEEEPIEEMMGDDFEDLDEIVYEIELDEEEDDEDDEEEMMSEEKMTVTPKGEGMGKPKFKYPSKMKGGVTETEDIEEMIEGEMSVKPKGEGMGKPKFKYPSKMKGGVTETDDVEEMSKEEATEDFGSKKDEYKRKKGHKIGDKDGHYKDYENEAETTEASRTYGNGSRNYPGRGIPKMKVIPNSALTEEVESLRAKNDEYRKALNIFRDKLNEVAVFNSNLAYAVRLFTENSTTKQEKINVLRRFDNVETLKESKALYKTIKDELTTQSVVTESVETKLQQTPTAGSSSTLIESKTYENPQFQRMKDLMGKLNK